MTTREAAKRLGVRPGRVRELIKAGRLNATHHPTGYYWVIKPADLNRYIKRGKTPRGASRKVDR